MDNLIAWLKDKEGFSPNSYKDNDGWSVGYGHWSKEKKYKYAISIKTAEILLKNETSDSCKFIDSGTGSGIIADTLVNERPSWQAFAADLSIPALQIAKRNCSERVLLFCNDKLSAVKRAPIFDFIVSNPPYISKSEMEKLDRSVTDYEPVIGLYGGDDGLDFYRYLAQEGKSFLKSNG